MDPVVNAGRQRNRWKEGRCQLRPEPLVQVDSCVSRVPVDKEARYWTHVTTYKSSLNQIVFQSAKWVSEWVSEREREFKKLFSFLILIESVKLKLKQTKRTHTQFQLVNVSKWRSSGLEYQLKTRQFLFEILSNQGLEHKAELSARGERVFAFYFLFLLHLISTNSVWE